jgi:predicted nicotinamide N-methyase
VPETIFKVPSHLGSGQEKNGYRLSDLEKALRGRYLVEAQRFQHRGTRLEMILPAAPEELIDVSAFNEDERLPYWAELWPAAKSLARYLLDDPPDGPTIELGCGLALPSLVLLACGVEPGEVLATDYYGEALDFARANAARNHLPELTTHLLDWRDPHLEGRTFTTALAADVLYERRNADALSKLVPGIVQPGGSLLLADPGRTYRSDFDRLMHSQGWTSAVEAEFSEPQSEATDAPLSHVLILRYRAPADAPKR